MKSSIITFFLSLILATTLSHGAVIILLPGQNMQSVINNANSGDIIEIPTPATFSEQVSITKSLTIRGRIKGQHFISGSLSISNLPSGKKVTLRNLNINGNIDSNSSNLEMVGCKVTGTTDLSGTQDSAGEDTSFIAFQSEFFEKLTSKYAFSRISYSLLEETQFEGKAELIGNEFNGRANGGVGIILKGSSATALISNNHIYDFRAHANNTIRETCIGILLHSGAYAEISNNLIRACNDSWSVSDSIDVGMGIFVKSDGSQAIITSNIIKDCYVHGSNQIRGSSLVYAPSSTIARYNNLHRNDGRIKGGISGHLNLNTDPKFTNSSAGDFTLKPDSPCIDAGPTDPQYNDRDGSRNDIGMFGGHNFIPDGRTTNKPIVLGLDIAPIAVPTGGTVTIESTGATVK
jgi:hypothetical protein